MKKKLANLILIVATFFGAWMVSANPDAVEGAKLFQMCAACHGQSGEGSQNLNTPASAGQSQWYVKQQLNNFRAGIRGSHSDHRNNRGSDLQHLCKRLILTIDLLNIFD